MAAAGVVGACRYLTGDGKAVTRAEIDALHAHGIAVVLNYEAGADAALGGAPAGRAAGAAARAAVAALGAPAGLPIYYSIDFEVTAEQMPTVLSFLYNADDNSNPARAYGQYSVLQAFGRPGWQTIAWSNGLVSPHAALYQDAINLDFHGSAVDHNTVLDAAQLGAWWPTTSRPAAHLTPALNGVEEMPTVLRVAGDGDYIVTGNVCRRCPAANGGKGVQPGDVVKDAFPATTIKSVSKTRVTYLVGAMGLTKVGF